MPDITAAGTPVSGTRRSLRQVLRSTLAVICRRTWLRRTVGVAVVLLALIGAGGIVRTFTAAPEVGFFTSAEGRRDYVEKYQRAMRALPAASIIHDVATGYGTIRAYEWSTPDTAATVPVLLLPGHSSGVPMWAENLPGFLAGHRVIALDALGDAGLSVQAVPIATMADQATWIDEVVQRLAPGGVHVVGHSFGGATAAAYARHHPDHVRSLVLLEPVFTFGYPPASTFWWATVSSIPWLPETWRESALGRIGGVDYDSADPIAQMIASASRHYTARLPTPSPLSQAEVDALTMPVYLGLGGAESLAGSDAAARAGRLPRGTVEVWPGATHSLPMQQAGPLAQRLTGFWAAAS